MQQLREAFAWGEAPQYLLRDRDGIYGAFFQRGVKNMGIKEVVSFAAPEVADVVPFPGVEKSAEIEGENFQPEAGAEGREAPKGWRQEPTQLDTNPTPKTKVKIASN